MLNPPTCNCLPQTIHVVPVALSQLENKNMTHSRNRKSRTRKGAAVAELAVCLPVIVLLVLGAIECCTMIFLRQSLHIAAYEGVRVAISQDADSTAIWSRCQEVITERRINGSGVLVTPNDVGLVARGTPIEVEVTAPCATNNALPLQFFGSRLMSAGATMNKE